MRHRLPFSAILWIILFLVPFSCTTRRSYRYIEPTTINKSLASIDSLYAYPNQTSIDTAAQTWSTFVELCRKNRFKEAYEFYNDGNNSGDFFVYINHSSPRYRFISGVLSPLILEYEAIDTAMVKLQELLELELCLEEFTMKYGGGADDYIPESFPKVITDLSALYANQGMVDEALNLMDSFRCAVDGLHGNPAYTDFCLALFVSDIYSNSGDFEKARETLENYKTSTQNNAYSIVDPKEIEHYYSIIDEVLEEIEYYSGSKVLSE